MVEEASCGFNKNNALKAAALLSDPQRTHRPGTLQLLFLVYFFGRDLQEQKEPGHIADEREQNSEGWMDGNTYANEAFKPVKKLTTTLIYYFIKTADGKLLMNVEAMEDFL